MSHAGLRWSLLPGAAVVLVGSLALSGCEHYSHPDKMAAVYGALTMNSFRSITLSQDRRTGVMTLNGVVGSADERSNAQALAQKAAPGYTIADNIRVEPTGIESELQPNKTASKLDHDIVDRYRAKIEKVKNLETQNIQYSANDGTLTLTGSVRTATEKREAEEIAKKVPGIKHVVNDIAVKSRQHPTSKS